MSTVMTRDHRYEPPLMVAQSSHANTCARRLKRSTSSGSGGPNDRKCVYVDSAYSYSRCRRSRATFKSSRLGRGEAGPSPAGEGLLCAAEMAVGEDGVGGDCWELGEEGGRVRYAASSSDSSCTEGPEWDRLPGELSDSSSDMGE